MLTFYSAAKGLGLYLFATLIFLGYQTDVYKDGEDQIVDDHVMELQPISQEVEDIQKHEPQKSISPPTTPEKKIRPPQIPSSAPRQIKTIVVWKGKKWD